MKKDLEFHVERLHQLKNVERCPHCCKHFRKLKEHLMICNIELDKRQNFCDCGKAFSSLRSYREHRNRKCTLMKKEIL